MRIINFKEFSINERLGVSLSSIMFADFLEKRVTKKIIDFIESGDQSLEEIDNLKFWRLRPYIKDWNLYKEFPVVGFEVILNFKKLTPAKFKKEYNSDIPIVVGGSASGFGNKNWKYYSKIVNPVKKITDIGLIIQIGIEIDFDKVNFNLEYPINKSELQDGITSTLYHELNHSYEHYKRTIKGVKRGSYRKPIYDRSFNTSITYAENNRWKFPKPIWDIWSGDFLNYTYISERFELNANVQEIYYYINKYPDKDIKEFRIYQNADYMEKFNPDVFYSKLIQEIKKNNWKDLGNFLLVGLENPDKIADKLKDMWISVYEKEVIEQKASPIISLNTLRNMSCLDFIKYWGKEFNKNGKYLKKKISNLKYEKVL